MDRRDFLRKAAAGTIAAAAVGTGLAPLSAADTGIGSAEGKLTSGKAPFSGSSASGRMKLSFRPYELKLAHVFTVSSYSRTSTPGIQLQIEYEGVTGYGEASMPQYLGQSVESVSRFLERVDLSRFPDPFQLEDILAYVDSLSPGDTAAKAAVDIALHDLVGKLLGAPWYRIWGLNPAKAPNTTFTIGIDTPEVVRVKTRECADRFRILKVKVGLDNDKEMIRTIREITDLPIAVDANQGWKDRAQALE